MGDSKAHSSMVDLTKGDDVDEKNGTDADHPIEIDTNEDDNPPRKRRKLEDGSKEESGKSDTPSDDAKEELLEAAKKRLSKWAARLFDKDRPRGLIEPPQTIPLNDEFLSAFGKREKETDEERGRNIEFDQTIDDPDDGTSGAQQAKQQPATKKTKREGCKVKMTNLAYQTSAATLHKACETFGPIEDLNLILDKDRQGGPTILNSGRAYVTFETPESAELCVQRLVELDGRQLRLAIASDTPTFRKSSGGGALARYWDLDISTKCHRCGQVGHFEADCTNEAKPRPCPLCAKLDHDMRTCPSSKVCFNCGVPGHVNRECRQPRGMPKRMVCGICFQDGHHRLQCRYRAADAPTADAICMVCGRRGHFMCKEMKWFFGLKGVSCFNCGARGHNGYDCQRPTLFDCVQDPELTANEIDRAEAGSFADEMDRQKRGRGRDAARKPSDDRGRHRSMPASRRRGGSGGSGGGHGGRRRWSNDRGRGYR